MPLITPEEARRQVRGEPADDEDLLLKSRAAERVAMAFLNRIVYESDEALAAGRAAGAVRADAARTAWEAARDATYADDVARRDALMQARVDYIRENEAAKEMRNGIVINEDIKVAMLLLVGHYFLNREATVTGVIEKLPLGVEAMLWPYRVGLGV